MAFNSPVKITYLNIDQQKDSFIAYTGDLIININRAVPSHSVWQWPGKCTLIVHYSLVHKT